MRRTALILGSMLLVVTACVTTESWQWAKPCATPEQLQAARRECRDEAIANAPGEMGVAAPAFDEFETCMERRGWRKLMQGQRLACDDPTGP